MLKLERHKLILNQVAEKQKVSTFDLAEQLIVSEDTIRRDLNELHNKGLLNKVYGGAFSIESEKNEVFNYKIRNEENKTIVAQKALSLLEEGQVIIMSGGTTNLTFAKNLPPQLKATIYTYSLPIAMQLTQYPNVDIIFIGGQLQKKAMVTIGVDVIKFLSNLKADICFMGVSSINSTMGLSEKGYEVSLIKKAMFQSSEKVIAMLTYDKLDTKMPYNVCDLKQLNTMITDLNPNDMALEIYRKVGINVL